ncbi:MAG: hypothetical protein HRU20_15965, partial [Pseudomonadales bacterium]|nr:hypothetical protein [Pseudomonadales bacterium]
MGIALEMSIRDQVVECIQQILSDDNTMGDCKVYIDHLLGVFADITSVSALQDLNTQQDTVLRSG